MGPLFFALQAARRGPVFLLAAQEARVGRFFCISASAGRLSSPPACDVAEARNLSITFFPQGLGRRGVPAPVDNSRYPLSRNRHATVIKPCGPAARVRPSRTGSASESQAPTRRSFVFKA